MKIKITYLALLATFTLYSATAVSTASQPAEQEWNFKVYLGKSEIGEHHFKLRRDQERTTLTTEADFKVRFLFVTAYRYQHVNNETWANDCLQKIDARTDANGRILNVHGLLEADGFRIEEPKPQETLPGCIKTFAYWNPDILEEDALLNPQTGELTPVTSRLLAEETLRVRGRDVAARKYQLVTDEQTLNIWYSDTSEWLALESTTKDGRTIRYELI